MCPFLGCQEDQRFGFGIVLGMSKCLTVSSLEMFMTLLRYNSATLVACVEA